MRRVTISHRGNLEGPRQEKENHPDYIDDALLAGFEVEVDVWYLEDKFWLGHDAPQYQVKQSWLLNQKFWHHAKNMEALFQLNSMKPNHQINCFYHQVDDCTLTSQGYIWTFPRKLALSNQSVAVMPERVPEWNLNGAYAVCTDHPREYRQIF